MKLQRENVQNIVKLTPLQRGMLYHYLKNPEGFEYFNQLILDLSGEIELDSFTRAWKKVLENNEILRTVFRWEETREPIQVVLKACTPNIAYYDLSAEADPLARFEQIRDADRAERFDLEEVPFRVTLCQLKMAQSRLIISNHHILYDGWSTGLILKEFFEAYHHLRQDQADVTTPKRHFKEFVDYLERRNQAEDEQYWRAYLRGFEPLHLHFNPQEGVDPGIGRSHFPFSPEFSNTIHAFVQSQEITLASLLYSAWGVVLQRYLNSEDVVFGTTVSGRNVPIQGIEQMVGLFINTIPFRLQAQGMQAVQELLKNVNDTLKNRGRYENTPLVDIRKYSGISQREELFNTMVVLENYKLDELLRDPTNSVFIDGFSITEETNFDLTVSITTVGNLDIQISYKKLVLNESIAEQMMNHFVMVIRQMVEQPAREIRKLELLTSVEREQIVVEFNNTSVPYERTFLIHERFEQHAATDPDRIAVIWDEGMLTYAELNQRANQLARILRQKGVQRDGIVAMMVERSPEMIIGIMAILKAGGAYLPIDPKYPPERIQYIMEDSCAVLLLTTTEGQKRVTGPMEMLDLSERNLFRGDAENLPTGAEADSLAYVIYTSGSTGKPKGVMIEHGSLVNRLQWMQSRYPLREGDTILQKTPFTFDVSVWELLWWAAEGARMCFLVPGGEKDPQVILDTIARHQVTVLHFVPSMLSIFLEFLLLQSDAELDKLAGLRQVFASGEALTLKQVRLFQQWIEKRYQARLTNLYGPTEATIDVSYFDCFPAQEWSSIPIGKPIDNLQLYILSQHQTLQPIGIPGELCIAGDGVARGYLNRPELTAERFVDHPLGNGKMYRTGDLARWLPDGNIEYLGRLDFQVKIRGNRIELGEITDQLLQHTQVKEAVVVAGHDRSNNAYLCAYIVPRAEVRPAELREHLARNLPDYMIPSYFVMVEGIPLTHNGKVDRKALPQPQSGISAVDYLEPANEVEEQLVAIWKEILQVEKIGVQHDFFELGGHSLKVTSLVLRIQREFGIKIPITAFFGMSTVRALARYIMEQQTDELERIPDAPVQRHYPLSSAQRRLYFLQQLNPEATTYNMVQAFQMDGPLDRVQLEDVFMRLIQRHEGLRTSFVMEGDEVVQTICEEVKFSIEELTLDKERPGEVLQSFIRPFDLSKAPLFRVGVGRGDDGKKIMILDIHHIIADGVSSSLLIRDWIQLSHEAVLPPLRKTYKDYAVWQQTRNPNGEAQKGYWLQEFQGELPVLDLVTDFPRPQIQSQRGDRIPFILDTATVEKLYAIARKGNTTLYMICMTAWFIFLHKLSQQREIVVGTVTAGRTHPDVEEIVGLFVNTLPIRIDMESAERFSDLLDRVKEKVLGGLDHQDYQFEDLIDDLHLERKMDRNPLFDVMFVLQDPDGGTLELPSATVRTYALVRDTAKFDLTLFGVEMENQLHFELEFCTDLFERQTIERYAAYFTWMISHLVDQSDPRIEEIELRSPEETKQFLQTFNHTAAVYSAAKTVPELFDEWAKATPERAAIRFRGISITYRELHRRAQQLAMGLVEQNVQCGDIVGICMDHSPELIVSILGVLKAGAAYLPIDPDFPRARKEFMLEDCQCKVVLTNRRIAIEFPDSLKKIYVDDPELYTVEPVFWQYRQCPTDLIYIIYTSGSTGTPKGCMITHQGVVNYVEWAIRQYFTQKPVYFPVYSSIAFDLTVTSIFTPLLSGQTVHLYPKSMDVLGEIVCDGLSNVIKVTPTHLRLLLDLDCRESQLETLIVGGEQLTTELARKVLDKLGSHVAIYNEYGPTETVVGCMIHRFDPIRDTRVAVPIGVPAQNMQVYILNEAGQVCPIGVMGEMYIGGVGVSPGYIHRPELTTRSFLPNPFTDQEGAKLYKTGDLAVYREPGLIEYISRKDTQIKIRGYRIEIGEITSAILAYPGMKDAVVVAKEGPVDKFLCAYVVSTTDVGTAAVKAFLAERLPEYMIPAFLIRLDTLPVAPGGKVDLKALPEPTIVTAGERQRPMGEIEEFLYKIWADHLQVTDFGTRDKFFDIGGSSFLLMKVHHQMIQRYPEIKLTDLFKYPTIQDLAQWILSTQRKERDWAMEFSAAAASGTDREDGSFTLPKAKGEKDNPIPMSKEKVSRQEIAIIGIGLNLTKAKNLAELYQVLRNRTDCIGYPKAARRNDIVDYLNWKGIDSSRYQLTEAAFLEEIDTFDHSFFKISFKEASLMDPYQRIFLQTVWHTFENAGYTRERLRGSRTGVFVGQPHTTDYYERVKRLEPEMAIMAGPGNIDSIISGRISYLYDLSGPSLLVNTACSSTLTAVHLACQSIRNQECEMALVGGINILIEPVHNVGEQAPAVLSSTGRAKTFSDDSDGTGRGEGCIAILLKPLDQAIRDKDLIHAVIKGSACNNDGGSIGITAPNGAAQEDVITAAWQNSKIAPDTIGYIEAHGTGTKLGDPIEVDALTNAFRRYTEKQQFCGLGAVKTNYGHLDSAAGLLGLVKAVISLQYKVLLPNLHFTSPNTKIDFISSPLYVVDEVREWETPQGVPRRCGVSAFGLSGTNCHLVLEEAPVLDSLTDAPWVPILPLSARTERALSVQIEEFIRLFTEDPDVEIQDVCYTAQIGREHFDYRVAIVGEDRQEIRSRLERLRDSLQSVPEQGIYYGTPKVVAGRGDRSEGFTVANPLDRSMLHTIAEGYITGGTIPWSSWYQKAKRQTVSLPGYDFERKRCWIEIPEHLRQIQTNESAGPANPETRGGTMTDERFQTNQHQTLASLQTFVANMFDMQPSDIDPDLDYFELGIDSISIIQLKQEVKNSYGLEIAAEKLFGEISTLNRLATYIQEHVSLEEEVSSASPRVHPAAAPSLPTTANPTIQQSEGLRQEVQSVGSNGFLPVNGSNEIANLLQNQLEIMSQQIRLLQAMGSQPVQSEYLAKEAAAVQEQATVRHVVKQAGRPKMGSDSSEEKLLQRFIVKTPPVLNEQQKRFLERFMERYAAKTSESKLLTQKYRQVWANGRTIQGFSKQWKEIIYPILSKKARGARIWDVNGNEYIDFAMGFGVNLFGYNHPVIKEAIAAQLEDGVILGSLTELSGEVAALVSELTGVERVAFANSGTEAVMNLLRIARATTGREKIAIFSGAFHGTFDGVYMMKNATIPDEHPIAFSLGTPNNMVKDVIMLDYGDPQSLEFIRQYQDELAAVLVEPVQSRNPDLQPVEFLRTLRRMTAEMDIALIFDEVITGFRVHPGGAQAYFGIEADLVSYGKVIGGGLPIGIFAGKARYMDRVDGGLWQYGDGSSPSGFLAQTGGTFCHHPLAMAAAKAALQMIKADGGAMQRDLNDKTDRMADYLNDFFVRAQVDLRVAHFGSLFIFLTKTPTLLRLMYYMLIEKGFYLWEGATCFISTEHSLEEIAAFVQAIQECCYELHQNECFPFQLPSTVLTREEVLEDLFGVILQKRWIHESYALITHEKDRRKAEELFTSDENVEAMYPVSPMQELTLAQNINYRSTGYDNSLVCYVIQGEMDLNSFQTAWQTVISRHSILRTGFLWRRLTVPLQVVYQSVELPLNIVDLSTLEPAEQQAAYEEYVATERKTSFTIATPPLIRFILVKLNATQWRFVLKYFNSLFDGWSSHLLFAEFMEVYEAMRKGQTARLGACPRYMDYIAWLQGQDDEEVKAFWEEEFREFTPDANTPVYQIRSSFDAGEYSIPLDETEFTVIKNYAKSHKLTVFTVFQGAWAILQSRLQHRKDLLIASICSGRPEELKSVERMAGLFSNVLPIRVQYDPQKPLPMFLKELQDKNLRLKHFEHSTIHQVAEWTKVSADVLQDAMYSRVLVYLNYPSTSVRDTSITIELEDEQSHVNVPFRVYIEPFDGYRIVARYNRQCYSDDEATRIVEDYKRLVFEMVSQRAR